MKWMTKCLNWVHGILQEMWWNHFVSSKFDLIGSMIQQHT
jgi:hypothetical protein